MRNKNKMLNFVSCDVPNFGNIINLNFIYLPLHELIKVGTSQVEQLFSIFDIAWISSL